LQEKIDDLLLIRESDNKEMIKIETQLNEAQKKNKEIEGERDKLIDALNDLTEKWWEVEKTCSDLVDENQKLKIDISKFSDR